MNHKILRQIAGTLVGVCVALLAGCGATNMPVEQASDPVYNQPLEEVQEVPEAREDVSVQEETKDVAAPLSDGVYTVNFDTDSSMFHLNESCEGRATLTVKEGIMTVHVPLVSKSIVNLFCGTAKEAQAADEAEWLQPVAEPVTYSDGYTEEVYAFDVPVPGIDVEFGIALIGTKGKWYDHTVCVTDPQPAEGGDMAAESGQPGTLKTGEAGLENGVYRVEVTLAGGSGRADIESPALVAVSDEGIVARVAWSSPYYDYMIVDGVKYEPVNTEGNSAFEIPVAALDAEIAVTADTVAMSTPHEIDYVLTFHGDGAQPAE